MGIYTISNVLNAAIPFLLLPFLTSSDGLSQSDYGVLSNFNALANFMIPLVGINLMAAVQVQYIKDEIDNRAYVSTGLRLTLGLALFYAMVLLVVGDQISALIDVPQFLLLFTAAYALFSVVIEVLLAIWRMEDRAINYGVFRVTRTLLEISLVLFFVFGLGLNFKGSIYGMMIGYGLGACVALVILARKKLLFGGFNVRYLKHAIFYGVPLIPHALSGVILMYSDKLLITYFHGQAENGVYSVGFMIGQGIGLLQTSFNQAWVPWVFQKLKANDQRAKRQMVKITYLYILGILGLVGVLYVCLPLIFNWFIGPDFKQGMSLVLWVALGFAFNGMYKMVSVYLFYLERTVIIAISTFGVAILNIILNLIFIPKHGMEGAAVATMLSMAAQFVVIWIVSSVYMKMPWFWKRNG